MLKIFVAITIIGLIMLFLGIFSYITATYKNETRGMFVFLIGLSVVMIIGGGSMIPHAYAQQTVSQKPASAQQQASMSSINQNQNGPFDGGAHQRAASKQLFAEKVIKKQLSKDYRKLGTVMLDQTHKTFVLTISNKDFNQAMTYLKTHPKQAQQLKWPKTVSGFEKTSLMIENGLNKHYQLKIIAKIPYRQPILTVANGHKIRSFVK
ncbi:MAG: DUF308 domain-containing protein [Lentilactobacillus diolivorans]|nr:DUF308 domain-containing protein [Lentilactobacillus diolivorans]RRG01070.1 MAG: DUF308 domain-containing protein [Lactobacillus sp.]